MEFLDPKKQRAHLVRLFTGYILVGVAVVLTTIILLYQAYGFGLKDGEVIQNGLVFVSSRPNPADIYVDGQRRDDKTDVRLLMPAGQYTFELKRDGYRPWKRAISIEGGTVLRFDYPVLFPTKLVTETVKKYDLRPSFVSQSPDRRWLLLQVNAAYNVFEVFDLAKPDRAPLTLTVPQSISGLNGTHHWRLVEWADDNAHILLQHVVDTANGQMSEYILVDREKPQDSLNLTDRLHSNPTAIELRNKKYDQYFLYVQAERRLLTATLNQPEPQALLEDVLAFKARGKDMLLYVTTEDALPGKVSVKLRDGDNSYPVRQVAADGQYLLELNRYDGRWYVVAGAPSENRTYIYEDPLQTLTAKPQLPLVPVHVLKTEHPSYLSFSDNTRFIMAQAGQQFSIYDAETDRGYLYKVSQGMDAPQAHAEWMDGHRLLYVSDAKTIVFDFDHANQETLAAADPSYIPAFDPAYETMYTVVAQKAKAANGTETTGFFLTSTALRTPADQ